jgi:hypothetical protein
MKINNKTIMDVLKDLKSVWEHVSDENAQQMMLGVKSKLENLDAALLLGYDAPKKEIKIDNNAARYNEADYANEAAYVEKPVLRSDVDISHKVKGEINLVVTCKEEGSFSDATASIITVKNGNGPALMKQINKVLKNNGIIDIKKL